MHSVPTSCPHGGTWWYRPDDDMTRMSRLSSVVSWRPISIGKLALPGTRVPRARSEQTARPP